MGCTAGLRNWAFGILAIGILAIGTAMPALAQTAPADTCRKDAHYRAQDFAVGTWDVYAGDKKTAEVRIEPILNDCVLRETWTELGRPDGNGAGLFNWSALLGTWVYHWATDTGATTTFVKGSLIQPGEMRYLTDKPLGDGKVRHRQWTLAANPDGTIREVSVGSNDDGKTWTTEYELKWVKHM
jgi:hypothetical protein